MKRYRIKDFILHSLEVITDIAGYIIYIVLGVGIMCLFCVILAFLINSPSLLYIAVITYIICLLVYCPCILIYSIKLLL